MKTHNENDYFGKSSKWEVASALVDVYGGELVDYYIENETLFAVYTKDGKEFTTSIDFIDIIPFMRGDKI